MNSKERVRTAYQHKEADRVPVGEMFIMSPVASEILGREAFTGEGGWIAHTMVKMLNDGNRAEFIERFCKDTLDVYRESGLDLLTTELDPPKEGSIRYKDITDTGWVKVNEETGTWAQFSYVPGNDTFHEVNSTEKEDLTYAAIGGHLEAMEKSGYVIDDGCFDSTRYMVEHAGDDMFLMAKCPNLLPSLNSWYTKFMEIMFVEPDLAHRLCDVYQKYAEAAVRKYIEIGVDCIMIAVDWAATNGPIYGPDIIREYLIPPVQAICELCHAHDVLALKHTDGNIMQFADDFFGMGIDGYQSVDPIAGMDIAVIKKTYGDKVLLMGNVDCAKTLPFGTAEEVIEETKSVIEKASAGGGHILSSSNVITYPTPAKNFLAMVETAHKYGAY